jgi:hypothetical protein
MTPFCFTYPVKALCTESQFPEDRFVNEHVVFHDASAHEEALDTTTDGDLFSTVIHINLMCHAVSC